MIAPHSAQHMIFVPKNISKHQESILHLLDMHCGEATGVITANKGQLMVKMAIKLSAYLVQGILYWWSILFAQRT